SGCDTKRVYDKNTDIPKYIWNLHFKPEFNVTITDTSLLYNICVNVRHTKFYPNSNLWILITTQFPDGKKLEKRVELTLADKNGRWYGDCLGDICDIRIPIQRNAFFDQPGNYTFQYEQIMRTDNLPFVMSMGLRVEKAGARRKPEV
ncbi:MAG TPA: gliding motility lipoprotein GldH, partial [Chitinophagales bacterium]|nr:gliding motility lipoprotein GldH [Chitinophagales bacterium]